MWFDSYPSVNMHEFNLDWILKTVKLNRDNVKFLLEEFDKIKVLTREEIQSMIDTTARALKAEVESYTDEEIAKATLAYQKYVRDQIEVFKVYVDEQDLYYLGLARTYTNDKVEEVREYIDEQIVDANFMFNPLSGKYEDVRKVTDDIINNYLKSKALTAGAYDALNKTAGAYDALNITAFEYDFNGADYLM